VDIAWVALSLQPHIGLKTLRALVAHCGSLDAALCATPADLQRVPGIGAKLAHSIHTLDLAACVRQMERWQQAGVHILPRGQPGYPAALLPLDDAPATLFALGTLPAVPGVAVVGTRHPAEAHARLAHEVAARLAQAGQPIISGLALGIDRAAHEGALSVAAGCTVAIPGSGVLRPYPPEHRPLVERILRHGALLSEAPPDAGGSAARLVARNRIISGLARALIVIETGPQGGAMYAARAALAQQRPLYAADIPAAGNQALLQQQLARPLAHFPLP
jgi:DNA processing protein